MVMAVLYSVTVSIAALTSGILSLILLVSQVDTSTSAGITEEFAGTRRRSSKVYAGSMMSECMFYLLEKNEVIALVMIAYRKIILTCRPISYGSILLRSEW
jgi:hypothetical protein